MTFPVVEGNYTGYIYAGDDFYNEVLKELSITIDKSTGTGTAAALSYEGLTVFPNTTSDIIKIRNIPDETAQIDLWNIVGNPVRSITETDLMKEQEIDLSGLEPGTYFIVTTGERENITGVKKIIKR